MSARFSLQYVLTAWWSELGSLTREHAGCFATVHALQIQYNEVWDNWRSWPQVRSRVRADEVSFYIYYDQGHPAQCGYCFTDLSAQNELMNEALRSLASWSQQCSMHCKGCWKKPAQFSYRRTDGILTGYNNLMLRRALSSNFSVSFDIKKVLGPKNLLALATVIKPH